MLSLFPSVVTGRLTEPLWEVWWWRIRLVLGGMVYGKL